MASSFDKVDVVLTRDLCQRGLRDRALFWSGATGAEGHRARDAERAACESSAASGPPILTRAASGPGAVSDDTAGSSPETAGVNGTHSSRVRSAPRRLRVKFGGSGLRSHERDSATGWVPGHLQPWILHPTLATSLPGERVGSNSDPK